MSTLCLMVFSLRQLSALGYWQAGAEMLGGDDRRAHADAHRLLQIEAARLLRSGRLRRRSR